MKNSKFVLVSLLCLSSIFSKAAIQFPDPTEHWKVDWTNEMYTANDIKLIVNSIPIGEDKTECKYPVFVIPLNFCCPLYTQHEDRMSFNGFVHTDFSEFVIKASTNNFLNGKGEIGGQNKMVYWSSSTTNLMN